MQSVICLTVLTCCWMLSWWREPPHLPSELVSTFFLWIALQTLTSMLLYIALLKACLLFMYFLWKILQQSYQMQRRAFLLGTSWAYWLPFFMACIDVVYPFFITDLNSVQNVLLPLIFKQSQTVFTLVLVVNSWLVSHPMVEWLCI